MLALKLLHLIERDSEELAAGLTKRILESERTCDFRKIPPQGLELAAAEVYRNLGQWLLYKTDTDISDRFQAIAANRVANGVGLHQFVWPWWLAATIYGSPFKRMLWLTALSSSMAGWNCNRCLTGFSILRSITAYWEQAKQRAG